jgi:peptidoglycan/LPS O-acetylase OafA/YrhL
MTGERNRPELLELTSLRAFAALHVVLFHSLFLLGEAARALPGWLLAVVGKGFVSVSFFFILSGFVLAYASCDRTAGFQAERRSFWGARVARIYPLYLLGFLMDVPRAVSYFLGTNTPLVGTLKALVSGGAYLTLVQSWLPPVASAWNAPGWSLSNEAFFYLLFPFLAGAVWRLRPARLWPLLAACCGASVLLAAPLVWNFHAEPQSFWLLLAGYNPLLRLPEFLVGVVLGRLHLERSAAAPRDASPARWLALVGALGVGGVLVLLGERFPQLFLLNGLLAPLFALIIYGLATRQAPGWGWLKHPVLVSLGRASYALYILHMPLQASVVWAGEALGLPRGPLLLASYLTVVLLVSLAAFRWVEEPARRWLRDVLARRARPVPG